MSMKKLAFSANEMKEPAEYIREMFAHTDGQGRLYIPTWPHDGAPDETANERCMECRMNWKAEDCDREVEKFNALYTALEQIAGKYEALDSGADPHEVLTDELYKVWNIYVRDFDPAGLDMDRIYELDELADEELTEKDKALLNAYSVSCHIDAMLRLGKSRVAYDVVIRAMRVCRLLALGVPAVIVRNEAGLLAQALTLRDHAVSVETVPVEDGDPSQRRDS